MDSVRFRAKKNESETESSKKFYTIWEQLNTGHTFIDSRRDSLIALILFRLSIN